MSIEVGTHRVPAVNGDQPSAVTRWFFKHLPQIWSRYWSARLMASGAYVVPLKRSLTILLLSTFLGIPLIGWAGENFRALTVAVLDGDTVEVLTEQHKKIRIRLAGIDAPEKNQAYGQRSKQNLASMVAGKSVDIIDHGSDQYGRTVGSLSVDGMDVNAEQVKAGYAWVYTRYNRDSMLPTLEENARRDQLGLWRDPNPTAPWEFRHSR